MILKLKNCQISFCVKIFIYKEETKSDLNLFPLITRVLSSQDRIIFVSDSYLTNHSLKDTDPDLRLKKLVMTDCI